MSAIENLLRQPAAQAVGWALLHFVWQGAFVGVLAAAALAGLRSSAADVRYVVSTIALSLMLTLPTVTAVQLWRSAIEPGPAASARAAIAPAGAVPAAPTYATAPVVQPVPVSSDRSSSDLVPSFRVERWLPALVLTWLCGVVVLSLRLMSGWLWVQRMKSHGTLPAGEAWEHLAARLSRRLHIGRRVRLLQSSMVDVPTVIGWLKPVILLPVSALSGLTPHQLEAILAHELAHIRRHDYLVNLLQTLVETLLFYHPAVWWLSRRIRAERENCCDDLAVSLSGDPYTYAKALADLEELRGPRGQLAMAATGGSLAHRIRRVLGAPTHAGRAPGWLAASASVLVMFGIAAGAVTTEPFQGPEPTASPSAATAQTQSTETAQQKQLTDEARATTAAAESLARKAAAVHVAARAATAVQHATHQATTPFLAGQTLEARASALNEAALIMAAEADSRRAAALEAHQQFATWPRLAGTDQHLALVEASRTFAAVDRALASSLPVLSSGVAGTAPGQSARSHGTMNWQHNGERMEVRFDGEVEFTDDDADVKRLSPGGLLRIKEGGYFGGLFASHTVEFIADGSGNIARRFWNGMSERPFDPEGREWLAKYLPRFIRQTGFGARARVARILEAKGPAGVLAEIFLIEGSWGKKTYFTELLKTGSLDAATIRQVLAQAGREIDSDFELASLLIDRADTLLVDDGARQAYFEAARTIQSDFEMARVYKNALKRGPVSSALLAALLDASRDIDSDFEQATLLIQVAKLQSLDNTSRAPFFTALSTVDSNFEHARVLKVLAERTDLAPETTAAMLTSAVSVDSDFEKASFLLELVKQHGVEGTLRDPFFRAAGSIASTFERGRVLQAVIRRPDASADTILAVLRSAGGMNSSFEASQVLLAVAAAHPVAGPARDAYIDAAEKLGDFEQGRVLSALVRSERRK